MTEHLAVNPIACTGHGICAELLPERVSLDDWGFPVIDPTPIPDYLRPHVKRAIAACPTLALLLQKFSLRQEPTPPPRRR
jgi:ferredoxin